MEGCTFFDNHHTVGKLNIYHIPYSFQLSYPKLAIYLKKYDFNFFSNSFCHINVFMYGIMTLPHATVCEGL